MTCSSQPDSASLPRIGWIGTGVMGRSMCGHLLRAGYPVTVFSRTRARAEPLLEEGAIWAESPAAVAARSDITGSIVGYPADVREVHLGRQGTLTTAPAGSVIIDFTTSEPALAVELAHAGSGRGVAVLDAPVSGGDIGARNAALSIMVGGEAGTLTRVLPVLQRLGKTITHLGPAGAGQHTKLVNQILIAGNMVGVCEALLYAWRSGLDLERVLAAVSGGAAGSWSLSNLAPRILNNDFAPGFFVAHFVKDLGIALAEAGRLNLTLPGLRLAESLYRELAASGGGELGTQALQVALARLSGLEWKRGPGVSPE
jgi:3-hydroxyisobutyrate dehydrogenase